MKRALIVLLSISLVAAGCASTGTSKAGDPSDDGKPRSVKEWMKGQSRAKRGAILGAIVGAAAGALGAAAAGSASDDVWATAAAGAAAGALAGYFAGKRKDKLLAGRDAAVAEIEYEPSQGYVIQVQEVRFDPKTVEPGQEAEMYVRYLVLGPNPKEEIVVQAFTGIKYDDIYLAGQGPDKFKVPRGGGIVETVTAVSLPEDAALGTYAVEALFEDSKGRFELQDDAPLYVARLDEAGVAG